MRTFVIIYSSRNVFLCVRGGVTEFGNPTPPFSFSIHHIPILYRVFQNKHSWHYCVVHAMGEFLCSRRGSTVFCVPCSFCSGVHQNTWTRLTYTMYSLKERVFFVKSYYRTQKNLKEVLRLYSSVLVIWTNMGIEWSG